MIPGLAQLTLMDEAHGFATALYGLLEPDQGNLVWSSAGHIPPLAFGPGAARWLSFAEYPPLRVADPHGDPHRASPPPGEAVRRDRAADRRGGRAERGGYWRRS